MESTLYSHTPTAKQPVITISEWSPFSLELSQAHDPTPVPAPLNHPHGDAITMAPICEFEHGEWQTLESWLPVQELENEPAQSQRTLADDRIVPDTIDLTVEESHSSSSRQAPATTCHEMDSKAGSVSLVPSVLSSHAPRINDAHPPSYQAHRTATSYYSSGSNDEIESDVLRGS